MLDNYLASLLPLMPLLLVLVALSGLLASSLAGFKLRPQMSSILNSGFNALGLLGSILAFFLLSLKNSVHPGEISLSVNVPYFPELYAALSPHLSLTLAIDHLSAFFLGLIFLISLLANIYEIDYISVKKPFFKQSTKCFYNLLTICMALVTLARDSLFLLVTFEGVTLTIFFLLYQEEQTKERRQASLIYLIATEFSTITLSAFVLLWYEISGSLSLQTLPLSSLEHPLLFLCLILGFSGFSCKAGLVPLHFWLPLAHTSASSHVSATLSGVSLKIGIYGILRFITLLPTNPDFPLSPTSALVILLLGVGSALLGSVLALGQNELKKILAYSSIENIGLIYIGLALFLFGKTLGRLDLEILGLSAVFLQIFTHALAKSLLFFNMGAIIQQTHLHLLDLLGGLYRYLPKTWATAMVGGLTLASLPPLNGFFVKLLLYMGLFHTLNFHESSLIVLSSLTTPILAFISALVLAGFSRLLGMTFQGNPKSPLEGLKETPKYMLYPLCLLAGLLVISSLVPFTYPYILEPLLWPFVDTSEVSTLLPALLSLKTFTFLNIGLVTMGISGYLGLRYYLRAKRKARVLTWDCGYAAVTSRLQYTASSFSDELLELTRFLHLGQKQLPKLSKIFAELPGQFCRQTPDLILDKLLPKLKQLTQQGLRYGHFWQQGLIHHYILYIFLTLSILAISLLWMIS